MGDDVFESYAAILSSRPHQQYRVIVSGSIKNVFISSRYGNKLLLLQSSYCYSGENQGGQGKG